ncbi:MAG: hypothetical protein J6M17_00205, partial [Ruminococcus sp.]|nr:hypothetical protein [Ruminococcus sp.]
MLEALYKYATDHELAVKPGFKHKNVKYYISFSADGKFLGFDIVEEGTPQPLCPDIGTLANGKTKSNIIVEKAEVIFNLPEKKKDGTFEYKREQKQSFYIEALKEADKYDKKFGIAATGLEEQIEDIREAFEKIPKAKTSDFVSVKVDGIPLESSTGYLEWWDNFRRTLDTKKKPVSE